MTKLIAYPLAVAAAFGWVFTVVASVTGLAGVQIPGSLAGAAFVGVFPLWLCAILYMGPMVKGARNTDLWKAVFRGCPNWLRYAIWGSWGYSLLMLALIATGRTEAGGVGFVGVFYASSLGVFVTAATLGTVPARCANGHALGPFDKFCAECGGPRPSTEP